MVSESKTLMEQADSLVIRIDEVQKAGLEYHVSLVPMVIDHMTFSP